MNNSKIANPQIFLLCQPANRNFFNPTAKESVNNFVSNPFQKDFGSKQNQFESVDFKPLFLRKICGHAEKRN